MNVFSASPVQSCDLTSGRLRKPRPPRNPERRRGMVEIDLNIIMYLVVMGFIAWLATE